MNRSLALITVILLLPLAYSYRLEVSNETTVGGRIHILLVEDNGSLIDDVIVYTTPSGRVGSVKTRDGLAEIEATEPGTWKVKYGVLEKRVVVKQPTNVSEETPPVKTERVEFKYDKRDVIITVTGLFLIPVIGIIIFLVLRTKPDIKFSKSYNGKEVVIKIENLTHDLVDVTLEDTLPNDVVEVTVPKENLEDNVVHWNWPFIRKGSTVVVNYGLTVRSGRVDTVARLTAKLKDRRDLMLIAFSNGKVRKKRVKVEGKKPEKKVRRLSRYRRTGR